ncbi:efflux RND transporter periplasmic adaptor subunit [Geobacter anodireducens]|uniref:Efflux RND transporter periplasmic adaptor subunit n=1 Tax=Geobacter anodireducens TaxID=1340425 RepID=A0ABR9NZ69_9BACT|nr:efflux RND transporter periplasmic adaptor subunit [Geobacter anodireducens]MBE2889550.1 efflux RND transporter periplasmic adaptor subunit [Geobacter anodireducens]
MLFTRKIMLPLVALLLALAAAGCQKQGAEAPKGDGHDHAAEAKVEYTCPMHPFIIKDKPGSCPICGMDLVKKVAGTGADAKELEKLAQVAVPTTQMVMANVATQPVTAKSLQKEITATGIVAYDQRRQAKVTAWVAGRIDRLNVNAVGDFVSRGRPVAELYSPDLVSAQQEYLLALKSRDRLKDSPIASISQGGQGLVASARQRLLLMGVKEQQIAGLEKAGQPNIKLPVYTPLSGVVIEKIAIEGQYVNMGDPLFTIADLSTVWVEAEIYESDVSFVKVGQRVEVTTASWPGRTFSGRISLVYPFLDPKTRTIKARIELSNPGLKLKPDMFVNAAIKMPLGTAVVVPVAAVMDTGTRQVVWVQVKEGTFEPRDVKVGARVGDEVQLLSGLKAGEVIACSGAYLIDSESQLRGGSGSHAGHEGMPGMEKEGAKQAPAAPPARKNDMSMDDMKM